MGFNKEQLIDPERILYCIAFAKNHAASKGKQIVKIQCSTQLLGWVNTFLTINIHNGSSEVFLTGVPVEIDSEIDGMKFVLDKL
jgi:hypothetical protein